MKISVEPCRAAELREGDMLKCGPRFLFVDSVKPADKDGLVAVTLFGIDQARMVDANRVLRIAERPAV